MFFQFSMMFWTNVVVPLLLPFSLLPTWILLRVSPMVTPSVTVVVAIRVPPVV